MGTHVYGVCTSMLTYKEKVTFCCLHVSTNTVCVCIRCVCVCACLCICMILVACDVYDCSMCESSVPRGQWQFTLAPRGQVGCHSQSWGDVWRLRQVPQKNNGLSCFVSYTYSRTHKAWTPCKQTRIPIVTGQQKAPGHGAALPMLALEGQHRAGFFFAEIIHSLLWCTLAAQHSLLQYYETRWWLTYSIFPIDNSSTLPVKVILQRNCRSPVQSKSFSKLNNVIMVASLFRHPLPSAGRICCRCVFMHEVQH